MNRFQVLGTNEDTSDWTLGIYQQQPQEPGLEGVDVVWKVLKLSREQSKGVPVTLPVPWDLDYEVCFPATKDGIVYYATLKYPASEGQSFELIKNDQGYYEINPTGKSACAGCINFMNNTGEKHDLGLMLSKSLLCLKKDTRGGVNAEFKLTPTYYIGAYNDVTEGINVKSASALTPQTIQFEDGNNTASVSVVPDGGSIGLSKPKYSKQPVPKPDDF